MGLMSRLSHAWNAFMGRDPTVYSEDVPYMYGSGSYIRPDRNRFTRGKDRTIIAAIYNRIALDCASVTLEHVRLDENKRYSQSMKTGLEKCLTLEANIDQTSRAFIQDVVMSMLDEGVVAVVPVDTTVNPNITESFDVDTLRVGRIIEWYPEHVKVNLYNEKTGKREDILILKKACAIIENPFYAVMNEPNSTMQRLIRKLILLDAVDEQTGSGKLNMIIQLPYVVKSAARKQQAEMRRQEIESQLVESKYGIAYTDGTEKVTQINRSLENNLMSQIEYLTSMLYSQLGMPQSVFDGTADEATMLNYNNRTIEPILSAIADEFKRKFLTKTARTQGQSIVFFKDPFKLVPVNQLADIADKFTRNEILSSNEVRQIVGMKPVDDPKADELRNKNLNESPDAEPAATTEDIPSDDVPIANDQGG